RHGRPRSPTPGASGARRVFRHRKRARPDRRARGQPGRIGPDIAAFRPGRHHGARSARAARARRRRVPGPGRAARSGPGGQLGPAYGTAQHPAFDHGLPWLGARQPPPDAGRNERPAAADGAHRAGGPVQSRPSHMDTLEAGRARPALPARPMIPPVVCIAGPTAAGKSASTLALAAEWPIEIINVDSATIYRGMDIGTAKPSAEERRLVPHHLLDIRDPAESYSAAAFHDDALHLIDE